MKINNWFKEKNAPNMSKLDEKYNYVYLQIVWNFRIRNPLIVFKISSFENQHFFTSFGWVGILFIDQHVVEYSQFLSNILNTCTFLFTTDCSSTDLKSI